MDFAYTEAQELLRIELQEFISKAINPRLTHPAKPEKFNRDVWRECASKGLLGFGMPEPWAPGNDSSFSTLVIALEAVGYACDDNALPFMLATQVCTVQQTLVLHASNTLQQRWLPGSVSGDLIGCHAMTEPNAGSDSGAIRLKAEKAADGYVLNGEKIMIGLAPVADYCVLFATVNPDLNRWGQTAFLVDTRSTGFEVSDPVKKMGLDSAPMGRITLRDCRVSEESRLGPEGAGAAIANHSLELERTCILASQIGRLQKQLENAVRHARNRHQFGQAIGDFQAVSHRLADMKLRLETARLLLYKNAWQLDQGQSTALESAMLKLLISESFLQSSIDSMRVHGGYAFIDDHESGRDTRDALGGILYAGTSDIQRNIIAGLLEL